MTKKTSDFDLDAEFVRTMGEMMKETDLSELEFSVGDKAIRLYRGTPQSAMPQAPMMMPQMMAPQMMAPAAPAAPAAPTPAAAPAPAVAGSDPAKHPGCVTSPMVGTVYLAPEPNVANFVKVGDAVKEGQTLLIIEAMKVMNPIPAAKSGIVKEIIVSNASPVEFGEALVIID